MEVVLYDMDNETFVKAFSREEVVCMQILLYSREEVFTS